MEKWARYLKRPIKIAALAHNEDHLWTTLTSCESKFVCAPCSLCAQRAVGFVATLHSAHQNSKELMK